MKQALFISLSIISIFFVSCTKKTGSPKACFDFSKEKIKVGDTLYLLNCSENFQKYMWTYPGNVLDSINRHTLIVASGAGTFEVKLKVGDYNFDKFSELTKSFTVE